MVISSMRQQPITTIKTIEKQLVKCKNKVLKFINQNLNLCQSIHVPHLAIQEIFMARWSCKKGGCKPIHLSKIVTKCSECDEAHILYILVYTISYVILCHVILHCIEANL